LATHGVAAFATSSVEVLGQHGDPTPWHRAGVVILALVLLGSALTSTMLLVRHRRAPSGFDHAADLDRLEAERAARRRTDHERSMADLADRQAVVRARAVLEEGDRTVVRARVLTAAQRELHLAASALAGLAHLDYDPAMWE
jgi:hypothetical protein